MPTWLQFGDLHASEADGWESLDIFSRLVDDANRHLADAVDFAVLPGDNANHATSGQFRKIAGAVSRLELPLHILPGDHDFESGSLADFYEILGAKRLPYVTEIGGGRCLFLDLVSTGTGGPDFRLDDQQMRWLSDKLQAAQTDKHRPVVFMHAYPNDLQSGGGEIEDMFARSRVAFVGTGHTHYNELINHRGTIYAATRSTGEVEEGPPGFSIGVLDGSVVSWHFKPIDETWPFVLITSPADRRLITDLAEIDQVASGLIRVRAKVFGGDVGRVTARVNEGRHFEMMEDAPHVWNGTIPDVADGLQTLQVEATTVDGDVKRDTIEVLVRSSEATDDDRVRAQHRNFEPIGSWPERNLLGSQLGPNKNGRKW
jgi:3',5'-cyclic-AMP phosphodiesterase